MKSNAVKNLSIKVSPDELTSYSEAAAADSRSMNVWARLALNEAVKNLKKPSPESDKPKPGGPENTPWAVMHAPAAKHIQNPGVKKLIERLDENKSLDF